MRVATLALGTRGDLELILVLGRELRRRGHDVVVATSSFFADQVRRSGLEWRPAGSGDRERMLSILRSMGPGMPPQARAEHYLDAWCGRELFDAAGSGQLRSLVANADYVVSNLKLVFDREGRLADRGAVVVPGAVVTYDPPTSLEDLSLYPPLPWQQRDILDLVALSQPMFDPVGAWGTWGKRYRFTGFWTDPSPDVVPWDPPPALAGFLAAGPAPVAFTPGSMIGFDADALVGMFVDAVRLAGLRGVLLPGLADVPASPAPDLLHVAGEVPYRWLFSRSACVVHHGSHGATAAALHAGKASVVIPQIACQETMGKALMWAGVGTAILDPDACDPTLLARAMLLAVSDRAVAEAVGRWQATVATEPGVVLAADLIERHHERGGTD